MINYYPSSITNTRGQINAVLSVESTEGVYGYGDEPVSVAEAKSYMKVDYDGDDELIETFITASRMQLEKFTGLSFIPKRIIAQLQNDCGGIELPYGPVYGEVDPTLITNIQGEETQIYFAGGNYPFIITPIEFVQVIYDAGFYELPAPLKTAIKAQVFFLYENRGEIGGMGEGGNSRYNHDYICNAALVLCDKWKRVWDAII